MSETPHHSTFLSLQKPYEWNVPKWFSVAFNNTAALPCFQAKHKNFETSLTDVSFPRCFVFNLDCNRLSVICTTLCYANDQHDSREMSSVG